MLSLSPSLSPVGRSGPAKMATAAAILSLQIVPCGLPFRGAGRDAGLNLALQEQTYQSSGPVSYYYCFCFFFFRPYLVLWLHYLAGLRDPPRILISLHSVGPISHSLDSAPSETSNSLSSRCLQCSIIHIFCFHCFHQAVLDPGRRWQPSTISLYL